MNLRIKKAEAAVTGTLHKNKKIAILAQILP